MGLEENIDLFENGSWGDYVVNRSTTAAGGSYDANGYRIADTASTLTIRAAVFPVQPRDLRVLPEGQRSEDSRTVYTKCQIYGRDGGHAPDAIVIDGEPFVAWSVRHWHDPDGDFYEVICARRPQGGGP